MGELPCDDACCVSSSDGYATVLIGPVAVLFTSASVCGLRQLLRCRIERLDREKRFRVLYFTLMFLWDVFDQTASWWFWSYTVRLGASAPVQGAALVSSVTGVVVIL